MVRSSAWLQSARLFSALPQEMMRSVRSTPSPVTKIDTLGVGIPKLSQNPNGEVAKGFAASACVPYPVVSSSDRLQTDR